MVKEIDIRPHYSLAVAVGIYVTLFYSANNTGIITPSVFFVSIVTITLSTLFFMVFISFMCGKIMHHREQKKDYILTGLLFSLFAYYMRLPVVEGESFKLYIRQPIEEVSFFLIQLIFSLATLTAAFFVGVFIFKVKAQRKMILILSLGSLILAYEYLVGTISHLRGRNTFFEREFPAKIANLSFKKKKNVYFLLFDGYGSVDGLELLGIKKRPFLDKMSKKGFRLYNSFFTNFQATNLTMPTYLEMDSKHNGKYLNEFPVPNRSQITAGQGRVYKIFKENKYKINIVHQSRYLLLENCYASFCFPPVPVGMYFQLFDKVVLNDRFRLTFGPLNRRFTRREERRKSYDHLMKIANSMDNHFSYFHFFFPAHTEYVAGICDEKKETAYYSNRIDDANKEILKIVENINLADPSGLIIVASDHGGWVTNKCHSNRPLRTIEEILDHLGAFLAIKWGEDYDGRFDEKIRSSANVFRYIFSYLLESDILLSSVVPDDAFHMDKKVIDNGVPVLTDNNDDSI